VEAMGVHVGAVAVFEADCMWLNEKYVVGRALDNRMGGYIIAEVVKKLKANKKKLPYTLYVVNSVQEEIGLRGAEMISRRLQPDVAICTDVTHDTTSPLYNKKKQGECKSGKGAVLTYGPAVQNNLLQLLIQTAKKKKINIQRSAVSRSTGTDTDSFAYSSHGVASALISLPLKYMHTTVEMVHEDDIQSCIDLMYETLLNIKSGQDFRYFS
jgi:putative aminopeptidase FrvX